jgi:hypothetical protein
MKKAIAVIMIGWCFVYGLNAISLASAAHNVAVTHAQNIEQAVNGTL